MNADLFGRVRLGYLVARSRRTDAWKRFAREGIGLHVDDLGGGELAMRIDDRARRLLVLPGDAEDVEALGFELDGPEEVEVAVERLRRLGAIVQREAGPVAAQRGVEELWSCVGPKRLGIELFCRPVLTGDPLQMRNSGFVTGAAGLGHFAITTREPEAMLRFWQEVLDARISDRIEDRLGGVEMEFTFLRLNERHHSMALAATRGLRMNPLRTRIHHLNLQAASFDDVVQAYRRCRELGFPIASAMGQHPNDKELSFYVETPSGFEIELGWNPIVVTEEAERGWTPGLYRGISLWGHFPESLTLRASAGRIARGLASLTRSEHIVGAAA